MLTSGGRLPSHGRNETDTQAIDILSLFRFLWSYFRKLIFTRFRVWHCRLSEVIYSRGTRLGKWVCQLLLAGWWAMPTAKSQIWVTDPPPGLGIKRPNCLNGMWMCLNWQLWMCIHWRSLTMVLRQNCDNKLVPLEEEKIINIYISI